jgi:hypothetical protein
VGDHRGRASHVVTEMRRSQQGPTYKSLVHSLLPAQADDHNPPDPARRLHLATYLSLSSHWYSVGLFYYHSPSSALQVGLPQLGSSFG